MNISPAACARALGVSRKTVYNWTANGHIPRDAVSFVGSRAYYSLERLKAAGFTVDETAARKPEPVEAES